MKSFALDIIGDLNFLHSFSSFFLNFRPSFLLPPPKGNVCFSLKTNSFKDDDFSQRVMNLFKVRKILILLSFVIPDFLARFFQLTSLRKEMIDYFSKLTLTLIEERKKNKGLFYRLKVFAFSNLIRSFRVADVVSYNDFIEMLLKSEADQVQKNFDDQGHINKKLTREEIGMWHMSHVSNPFQNNQIFSFFHIAVGQAFIFFLVRRFSSPIFFFETFFPYSFLVFFWATWRRAWKR